MLRQRFIQEGVIGIQQGKKGSIVAEHVLEKPDGLFIHFPAEPCEGGVESLVLVIVLVEPADMQPLAGKLDG